jgi:Flp pilus assembly pilin Flp
MVSVKGMLTGLYVRLSEQPRGQAMPEYAVITAAIIVAAYATFKLVGGDVNTTMNTVVTALTP